MTRRQLGGPSWRYLLGFAEHDLAVYNGAAWYKITPPADCGWLAYVQDEDETYQFVGSAWVALAPVPASQSEMEAATSLLKAVTPGRVRYNPGVAKFWAALPNSGTPTVTVSHNVTSVTDSGEGITTITIADDFSSTNWAHAASVEGATSLPWSITADNKGAGSIQIRTRRTDNGALADIGFSVVGFGDQ